MFYIEDEGKILLFDEDKEKLINTLAFMPQYQGLEIKETERPIENFQFTDTEEFQQEQAQKERERINMLSLTAADVERAIYKAKGMDFEDIVAFISDQVNGDQVTKEAVTGNKNSLDHLITSSPDHSINLKALKIELKANNFYRGNPYIEQVGALLGFTPQMLDEFFETNDYTKLVVPVEEVPENNGVEEVENTPSDINTESVEK